MIATAILSLFFPYIIFTFYLFDRIVKFECKNYRKNWKADGKPIGFYWIPEEARGKFLGLPKIRNSFARNHFAGSWIYATPEWAKGDAQAAKLLLQYRLVSIIPALMFYRSYAVGSEQ